MDKPLTARQMLDNLTDMMVEDIMALSDDELRAEIIEDGGDPDEIAARGDEILRKAIAEARRAKQR